MPCDIRGRGASDDCDDVFWSEQKPWHGAVAHGGSGQRGAYFTISACAFAAINWSRRSVSGPDNTWSIWADVGSTNYAIIASIQLLVLFTLWTPSGIVWWQAEGAVFWAVTGAYAASWLILLKASFDAGAQVQSGALGWMSLMARIRPVFPDMPTVGLFRLIRQPIYVAFTLTLWTVPIWTPDQLALAICFSTYCLRAPRRKERSFAQR